MPVVLVVFSFSFYVYGGEKKKRDLGRYSLLKHTASYKYYTLCQATVESFSEVLYVKQTVRNEEVRADWYSFLCLPLSLCLCLPVLPALLPASIYLSLPACLCAPPLSPSLSLQFSLVLVPRTLAPHERGLDLERPRP